MSNTNVTASTTPEPRDCGGVAGPAPTSSRVRGWRRLKELNAAINDSWIGDLLGGLGLGVGLLAAFALAWGWTT